MKSSPVGGRRWLAGAFVLASLAVSASVAAAQSDNGSGRERQRVTDAVHKLAPAAEIDSLEKSDVPGFYAVVAAGQVLYVSADGKYLMQGSAFDLARRRDLSALRMAKVRKTALAKVPSSKRIVFAPAHPKYAITVFTDLDCAYCRKLHSQIAQYNAEGIAVNYLFFPRTGIDSPSYDKAVSVWCAKDRKQAFTRAKAGQDPAPAQCANPVAEEFKLGVRLGVNGTPAVIASDGTQIGGYLDPAQMLEHLQALDPAGSGT